MTDNSDTLRDAAPELLQACRLVLQRLTELRDKDNDQTSGCRMVLSNAIAEAEGLLDAMEPPPDPADDERLAAEMLQEGKEAPGLACGELCVKGAKVIRRLIRDRDGVARRENLTSEKNH